MWDLPKSRLAATKPPICVFRLVAALMLTASLDPLIADGAPVTFVFQAEVIETTPSVDVAFSLPSEFIGGAKLNGALIFEPPSVFGARSDGASLRVSEGSFSFVADQRQLITENDNGVAVGGSVVLWDRVLVQCGATADCTSPIPITSKLEIRGLSLALMGDYESIDPVTDSPADPETWNRLPSRRLFLLFGSPTAAGSITVIADVGQVHLAPEPSAYALSILTALFGFCPPRYLLWKRGIHLA